MFTIQKAIFSALTSDATLMAMITGVYDHVPQQTDFPYIEIGESSAADAGTKTEDIEELNYEIHSWARNTGHYEIKQIQDQVRTTLHNAALSADTGTVVLIQEEFRETITDADGESLHGIQRYSITYQY